MTFSFFLPLLLTFTSVTPVNDYFKSEVSFKYNCPSCVTIEDTYGNEVYSNNYINLTFDLYYKMSDNSIDWYVNNMYAYMKMEVYTHNGDDYLTDLEDTFLISNNDFYHNTLQSFIDTCNFTFEFYTSSASASVIIFRQGNNVHDEYQEYQGLTFNYNDIRNFSFDTSSLIDDINNYCKGQLTGTSNDYQIGYTDGYSNGYLDGEGVGYSDGFQDGASVDDTAIVIFNGILNIALVPINFFLAIFNWELFGINMSALVTSILSVCLVVIVVRLVTGKNADGK